MVLNTTQGGIAAVLCGVEYDREANSGGSLRREDEREMPRCSQHEWRHQRGKGEKNSRWAFDPITGQVYPKETTDSFLSRQEHGVCLLVLVVAVRTCIIRL